MFGDGVLHALQSNIIYARQLQLLKPVTHAHILPFTRDLRTGHSSQNNRGHTSAPLPENKHGGGHIWYSILTREPGEPFTSSSQLQLLNQLRFTTKFTK